MDTVTHDKPKCPDFPKVSTVLKLKLVLPKIEL